MVGCGGFGPANAGVMIIVRAAAKEPAIVALAMMLFEEFIGVILSGNGGRCGSRARTLPAMPSNAPENPATRRLHSKAGSEHPTRHAVVMMLTTSSQLCDGDRLLK